MVLENVAMRWNIEELKKKNVITIKGKKARDDKNETVIQSLLTKQWKIIMNCYGSYSDYNVSNN